jgi:outer membrane protein assembly factor BamB
MSPPNLKSLLVPAAVASLALAGLTLWLASDSRHPAALRIPGTDKAPGSESGGSSNAVLAGKLTVSKTVPATSTSSSGSWPGFRGKDRDGISKSSVRLSRAWDSSGPRQLWTLDVGDGYAGVAVLNGRVYLMDYDRERKQDALRCLSADDGSELWRFSYPMAVKRNHGMSRTVPAVTERWVVAMGPKCHLFCLDSSSGTLKWGFDLVKQLGATVPPWYAGQCPLIDGTTVIVAPGGPHALLMALDAETGKILWQTPNPHGWKMTHSSIMPMELNGERTYVYCANNGVVGVSAKDGALLWETTAWKISIATVPSPLVLENGRIFLSGGYNAGSLMMQVRNEQGKWQVQTLFKLEPEVFGATQHTPILFENHLYGVRADGRFVCIDLQGKPLWASDAGQQFGLGGFVIGDGLIFAINDSGLLRLIEATPQKYNLLGHAQVLPGHESWGPMALADGRLFARDLTHLVCLDVAAH